MSDRELELAKGIRKLLDDSILPQVGGLAIDMGLLNNIAMTSETIIQEHEEKQKPEQISLRPEVGESSIGYSSASCDRACITTGRCSGNCY